MYRYSANKYNSSLLAMGVLRIGTLHDFRKTEHARGIHDDGEGKKSVSHKIGALNIADTNDPANRENIDFRAIEQFGSFKLTNCRDVTFSGITFVRRFDAPDCFILCTSRLASIETMQEFEGAETCVRVKDVPRFYQLITETLSSLVPVVFRGVHSVIYNDRDEAWNGRDWGHHPALIKPARFAKQEEIRAIWQPKFASEISPTIIANHLLVGCCEEIVLS